MAIQEIEQKFAICTKLLPRFRLNQGSPPFHQLRLLRTERFEDSYYDSGNKLSSNGLWVRKRGSTWEAKQSKTGNFIRSTFNETNNIKDIKALIAKYTTVDAGPENSFGLSLISRFQTLRELYRADEKFSVILDATNFGHWVGEVELMAVDGERAHAEIDAFIHKYAWFFAQGTRPEGKLTAYFKKFGYPNI